MLTGRARRARLLAAATLIIVVVATAWAADVVVEDWSQYPVGTRGIPPGWEPQKWGSPSYDFDIAPEDGRKALHLRSKGDGSTISRELKGKVDLRQTPILEWSWKVVLLPRGADSRQKALDDQAAQVFITWPRFPEMVRSRIIGYVWDTTAPVGTVVKSQKTGTVTYVVVRSGTAELGKWFTERRNVREDFKRIYGDEPDPPGVLSIAIDSNDTNSSAESFIGALAFRSN